MDDIILLEGDTLDNFLRYTRATDTLLNRHEHEEPYRLRIAVDNGQLKVKVNEYVWSPPLGTVKTGEDAR